MDAFVTLNEQAAQVAIGAEEELGLLDGRDAGGELERAGHRAALDGVGGLLRFGGGVGVGPLAPPERLALQAVVRMSRAVSNRSRVLTGRMVTPPRGPNYAT